MITGSTTAPPIKVVVPLLCHYFILGNLRLVFFFCKKISTSFALTSFVVRSRGYTNNFDSSDRHLQLVGRK